MQRIPVQQPDADPVFGLSEAGPTVRGGITGESERLMALPDYTMRQLLEAGVHFGHQTQRWNPRMEPYIFGKRNSIHIIDLEQTVPLLHQALIALRDVAANGGRVLMVGTKRQASEQVAETAKRCGQYYVNHRWLGGMMTNWNAVSGSIRHLNELDEKLADENLGLTKKELLKLTRAREKLERSLGGIKDMGGLPDILFIIDTNKEEIAVREAAKLGIPVVAVIDSNSDPSGIAHPIPGNDDSIRAIQLYCDLAARAVLDGLQKEMSEQGEDIGALAEQPAEDITVAATVAEPPAPEAPADVAPTEAPAESPAAEAAADAAPAEALPLDASANTRIDS
jgi:small subunit ribosomal protein S2